MGLRLHQYETISKEIPLEFRTKCISEKCNWKTTVRFNVGEFDPKKLYLCCPKCGSKTAATVFVPLALLEKAKALFDKEIETYRMHYELGH